VVKEVGELVNERARGKEKNNKSGDED